MNYIDGLRVVNERLLEEEAAQRDKRALELVADSDLSMELSPRFYSHIGPRILEYEFRESYNQVSRKKKRFSA